MTLHLSMLLDGGLQVKTPFFLCLNSQMAHRRSDVKQRK